MITIRDLLDRCDPHALELLDRFTRGEIGFEEYLERNRKYIETLDDPEESYDRAMGVL